MTGIESCRKGDKRMKQAEHPPATAGASIAAEYSLALIDQLARIDRTCSKEEMDELVYRLLSLIGEAMQSDRVFLFERLEGTAEAYCNTFEWCANGVAPQIDNLTEIVPADMPYWLEVFGRGETIVIPNIEDVKTQMPSEYEILKAQSIRSEIAVPVFYRGNLSGFFGLDNPQRAMTAGQLRLLAFVGGHLGSARENLRMLTLLEEKQKSLEQNLKAVKLEQQMLKVLCKDSTSVYRVDLMNAADAARRANEAKSEFLSRMSHDIRTPMNAIMGFTNIALQHADDSDKMKECLEKIRVSGSNLQELIDDVPDISRIESGEFKIVSQPVKLPELFDFYCQAIAGMVEAKNIRFSGKLHDISHNVLLSDQIRLGQIYMNLLSNAVKYTPENGDVKFEVYEEKLAGSGKVRLVSVVSDTGIGMTPEFMEQMYSAFSRAVDTRVNKVRGSGLGLAIVKKIVDLMGGAIEAESKVGKGTTFRVTLDLPAAADDAETKEHTETAKHIPIIALTANAYHEYIQKCLAAGMNAHLSKPINIDRAVRTIIECARTAKENG